MKPTYLAGNGNQIKGYLRKRVKETIMEYIDSNTINGEYMVFNDSQEVTKRLYLKELHKTVVRRKGFFVNSADFADKKGNRYSIDFVVAKRNDSLYVMNALMYFFNKKESEYFGKGMTVLKVA